MPLLGKSGFSGKRGEKESATERRAQVRASPVWSLSLTRKTDAPWGNPDAPKVSQRGQGSGYRASAVRPLARRRSLAVPSARDVSSASLSGGSALRAGGVNQHSQPAPPGARPIVARGRG